MSDLSIVGGYYRERCFEPTWDQWFGPGFRAAAALSDRGKSLSLHTLCPASERDSLEFRCLGFGIDCRALESKLAVSFSYLHWLAKPEIEPSAPLLEPPREIEDANVLCFGLYEASSSVTAERCVYDPQNRMVRDSIRAEHIVVSCNISEARSITGIKDGEPDVVAKAVAEKLGAEAVLVKGAWTGLYAWTPACSELIPAIPTSRVHKIGSGDIFSAEFSYAWLVEGADFIEGARAAVERTAHYCENGIVPNPPAERVKPPTLPRPPDGLYDIYLAAPFFDVGQMVLVNDLRNLFRDVGLTVFSPYHDVGWGAAERVAEADLAGLTQSRCVFACLGALDVGTIFETGHARSLGLPVIVYAPRLGQNDETMLVGTGCEIVRDFTTAVYRAIWICDQ